MLKSRKIPTEYRSVNATIIGMIDQRNLRNFKVFYGPNLIYQDLDHAFHRVHNNYFPRDRFGLNLFVDIMYQV